MPADLMRSDDGTYVATLTGRLTDEEFKQLQARGAEVLNAVGTGRLLMDAREFSGWAVMEAEEDLSFFFSHGTKIEKIAVVADSKWRDRFLMFLGAGYRPTEVVFFETSLIKQAHEWLRS